MSNIIEHNQEPEDVIVIGSGQNTTSLSLKTYQDIYHQITGNTEEIRKRYKEAICLDYSDVEQLHHKIEQLCDIHNIVAANCTATIFYEKDRKEQFTSFEKLRSFNANSPSPVDSLVLQYKFSIVPAKLKKPQEYTITIRISSRVTQIKQILEEAPTFMAPPLVAMVSSETTEIRIQYVDYVIARGFIEAFDEWIAGCTKTPENKAVKWLQKRSHIIPPIGKLVIALLYSFFIYQAIDRQLGNDNSMVAFSKFFIISGIAFYVATHVSNLALRAMEMAIDGYSSESWLKLNKGDEQTIREYKKNSSHNTLKLIVSSIFAVFLGIISSQISTIIDHLK